VTTPPAAAETTDQQPGPRTGAAAARPSRSATRTSELVGRLREDLLAGALKPGEPLRLAMVRQRYGAGLTPLREALFQLVAEGLVTTEDQRGFRVAEVSRDDLTDLTEQRVFLEGRALRLAIEHGDLAWESSVLAAHHRLANTPMLDPDTATLTNAWSEAHRDFHRVLVEACGSSWLLRFREVLSDQAERYRRLSIREGADRDVALEHRRLAEAVLARDADLAVERLAAHYRLTAELCNLPQLH
jgi:GntR family carbon starvation induced transcriptional regulator